MTILTPSTPKISLSLLTLLLLSLPLHVNSQVSGDTEQDILIKLKHQWGDPTSLQNWSFTSPPCTWKEIDCTGGSVTGLRLGGLMITSEIPEFICNLNNLTYLDLSDNSIPETFPTVLYNCSKLQFLNLAQNLLVGTLPNDIDRLRALEHLDVSGNNFTGDIPPTIGNLTQLKFMRLHLNLFNGTFPPEIGNLTNLEELLLAYNMFQPASIPPAWGKLGRLKYIWMASTNLIGEIPVSFGNLVSLEHLDLSLNNMEGQIPNGIFSLKSLSVILLYRNKFSGQIPTDIQSLNLAQIDLAMNDLTGNIPDAIGNLQQLQVLSLFSNQLQGTVPEGIGLLQMLTDFRVYRNNLTGILPPELGLHSRLQAFEVSDNQFTGTLPENLCARGSLFGLIAFSNGLSGSIPKALVNCDTLRTIQLYNNGFSGEVPAGMWRLLNLTSLMLSHNSFTGELPSKVAWNLTRLEIDGNKFSGQIPVDISSWARLIVFKASDNMISGPVPVQLTGLPQLTTLLLDGNSLSGELPAEMISWISLTTLNLSRNSLSGPIPASIGSLPDLIDLDLSQNKFSGKIPLELGQLKLTTLNLSSNQLVGKIPIQFSNMAYESSFLNISHICAMNAFANVPSCSAKLRRRAKNMSPKILAVVLVIAVAVFLIATVMTVFLVRDLWRKKQKRDRATWKLTSFQRLDFSEVNILTCLTEGNLIGSGGSGKVYKIHVNRPGEYIAVKKIWTGKKVDERNENEFLSEIQILSSVKHSNIVKLLCCISSEELKLLVYEYMENHSLDIWLHRKNNKNAPAMVSSVPKSALNWPMRLKVAIGAAHGLSYMHHDCTPPILHRDVKSSNILLDAGFNAKIADFGLAKLLEKKGELNTMSVVAGSFGYIAPEYAYTTKVNEKTDVYSFGVVLLELVTGREPNCGAYENTSLAEWAWKHYSEGKAVTEIMDEDVKEQCHLEAMTTVLRLGLICTNSIPTGRPSMKEVLQLLLRCRSIEEGGGKKAEYDIAPLLGSSRYLASYKRQSKKFAEVADESCIGSVAEKSY